MLKEILDTIKENPTLAIGTLIGGIGGITTGAFLGSASTTSAILMGGALGIAGTALGAVSGHLIQQNQIKNTPAPLGGILPVSTPPIQPGQPGRLSFMPTPDLIDRTTVNATAAFQGTSYYAEAEPLIPMIKNAAIYGRMHLEGTANAAGTSMNVTRAIFAVPGTGQISFPIQNTTLPLRDGQIDQNNPEAKAKIKEIFRQGINIMVPPSERERVTRVLDQTLAQTNVPAVDVNLRRTEEATTTPVTALAAAMQNGTRGTASYDTQTIPYAVQSTAERTV